MSNKIDRKTSGKKIVITGDSFVEGIGAEQGGWAQMLAANFASQAEIVIHGIGGQSTADLLARIDGELARTPDIVIIGIGTNDSRWRPSLGRNEVPLGAFCRNLEALICKIAALNAVPVLLELTRVDETLTVPFKEDKVYRNQYLATYSDAIRDAATAYGGHFITTPRLANVPGTLSDGLHPSDLGHHLLLTAILASFEENKLLGNEQPYHL